MISIPRSAISTCTIGLAARRPYPGDIWVRGAAGQYRPQIARKSERASPRLLDQSELGADGDSASIGATWNFQPIAALFFARACRRSREELSSLRAREGVARNANVTAHRHSRCHNRRRARSRANTDDRQTSPAGYDCAAFARPAPRVPLSTSPELSPPFCGEPLRLPLRAADRKSSRRRYDYWAGTGIQ